MMRQLLLSPFVPLVGLSVITTVRLCAYLLLGASPSPLSDVIIVLGWALLLVLWIDADARRSHRLPCYDFGFLAGVTFPASLVWYCVWSRGWRGLLVLLGLIGLVYGPWLVAAVLWGILSVLA